MIIKDSIQPSTHSMIWAHGLGAGPDDMIGLAEALGFEHLPLRHVFLQAPNRAITINGGMVMPAWYDIRGTDLVDREDSDGLNCSKKTLEKVIEEEAARYSSTHSIFLCGFSQGGALALYTGLQYPKPLAGIIALSAYLPLRKALNAESIQSQCDTPIFLAGGDLDQIVQPQWQVLTQKHMQAIGINSMSAQRYPIGHCVCEEEILALKSWLQTLICG
jgi:phospholipase/carboxylesterase